MDYHNHWSLEKKQRKPVTLLHKESQWNFPFRARLDLQRRWLFEKQINSFGRLISTVIKVYPKQILPGLCHRSSGKMAPCNFFRVSCSFSLMHPLRKVAWGWEFFGVLPNICRSRHKSVTTTDQYEKDVSNLIQRTSLGHQRLSMCWK